MKKAILIFFLIMGAVAAKAQDSDEPKLPPDLDMLRYFYTSYIVSFSDGQDPRLNTRKQVFLRRGFFTERGLKRYQQLFEEKGYDPILKEQYANLEAANTLKFAKDPKQPNRYTVAYEDPDKITIELSLVKEKDEWRIDYLY
jgi:hypothetical protein